MTSYMALFFTAFVYTPFGDVLVPLLEFWGRTAEMVMFSDKALPTRQFRVNPQRISGQMFYFTVTAQIVNFATEVIVPYVTHKASAKAKELQGAKARAKARAQDPAEEADFLKRVREECELDVYDVTGDYREMVMQYGRDRTRAGARSGAERRLTLICPFAAGFLTLFSVAWPLAACCFLVNNWVELRSDALKIAISCKRPIPWRSDSIGPWLTAIEFLSWLGSITSSAIVYLCSGSRNGNRGTTSAFTAWGFLLVILFAEHFYLAVKLAVRHAMGTMESPGLQHERKERYLMKKRLLSESLGRDAAAAETPAASEKTQEQLTRATLEEEARQGSISGQGTPGDMYETPRGARGEVELG